MYVRSTVRSPSGSPKLLWRYSITTVRVIVGLGLGLVSGLALGLVLVIRTQIKLSVLPIYNILGPAR